MTTISSYYDKLSWSRIFIAHKIRSTNNDYNIKTLLITLFWVAYILSYFLVWKSRNHLPTAFDQHP